MACCSGRLSRVWGEGDRQAGSKGVGKTGTLFNWQSVSKGDIRERAVTPKSDHCKVIEKVPLEREVIFQDYTVSIKQSTINEV